MVNGNGKWVVRLGYNKEVKTISSREEAVRTAVNFLFTNYKEDPDLTDLYGPLALRTRELAVEYGEGKDYFLCGEDEDEEGNGACLVFAHKEDFDYEDLRWGRA